MIREESLKVELQQLIQEYDQGRKSKRFQDKISFGRGNLYSLFIWSPIEQYDCPVVCPHHQETQLKFKRLTTDYDKESSNKKPR